MRSNSKKKWWEKWGRQHNAKQCYVHIKMSLNYGCLAERQNNSFSTALRKVLGPETALYSLQASGTSKTQLPEMSACVGMFSTPGGSGWLSYKTWSCWVSLLGTLGTPGTLCVLCHGLHWVHLDTGNGVQVALLGPVDLQRSLPASAVLWFCVAVAITPFYWSRNWMKE